MSDDKSLLPVRNDVNSCVSGDKSLLPVRDDVNSCVSGDKSLLEIDDKVSIATCRRRCQPVPYCRSISRTVPDRLSWQVAADEDSPEDFVDSVRSLRATAEKNPDLWKSQQSVRMSVILSTNRSIGKTIHLNNCIVVKSHTSMG